MNPVKQKTEPFGTQGSNNMCYMAFMIFVIFVYLGDVFSLGPYTWQYTGAIVFSKKINYFCMDMDMDSFIVIRQWG